MRDHGKSSKISRLESQQSSHDPRKVPFVNPNVYDINKSASSENGLEDVSYMGLLVNKL